MSNHTYLLVSIVSNASYITISTMRNTSEKYNEMINQAESLGSLDGLADLLDDCRTIVKRGFYFDKFDCIDPHYGVTDHAGHKVVLAFENIVGKDTSPHQKWWFITYPIAVILDTRSYVTERWRVGGCLGLHPLGGRVFTYAKIQSDQSGLLGDPRESRIVLEVLPEGNEVLESVCLDLKIKASPLGTYAIMQSGRS